GNHDAPLPVSGGGTGLPGTIGRRKPAKGLLHVGLGGAERRRSRLVVYPVFRQVGATAGNPDLALRPLTRAALNRDSSRVQARDVVHQRQPDARTLVGPRASALDPVEALEETWHLVVGNAAARVPDPEEDRVAIEAEGQPDRSREGELQRVGEEVEHHP